MMNVEVKDGMTMAQKNSRQAKQKYSITKFYICEWEVVSVK